MQVSTGPIGSIDKYKKIHIFGAGISGLVLGYYLKKHGHDITIFEKKSRPGGKIKTELTPNGPIEFAANAIFSNDDVIELLNELEIPYITATEKLKKKIFRNGKIFSSPLMPLEMIKVLFRLYKRPPKITVNLTVFDFFKPLLGEKLCHDVLDAALSGIYATPSSELHFLSLFKVEGDFKTYLNFFLNLKKKRKNKQKAQSLSFKNGMQDFIFRLEDELKENIRYDSNQGLSDMANNIICTESFNAAVLTENSYPALSKLLKEISYISLQTSTFILNKKIDFLDDSFGIVFSKKNHPFLKGILHNTGIFHGRSNSDGHYSYTFITEPLDEAQVKISNEVKNLFEIDMQKNTLEFRTKKWENGIPIYNYKRADLVGRLRSEVYAYPPGIVLFGNYIDGISIREMIGHAKEFSKK